MQFSNFLINCKTRENVNYAWEDPQYHFVKSSYNFNCKK